MPEAGTEATRTWAEPSALRLGGFARRAHLVAHAPHGDDRRRVAELAAELAHVYVDRARVAGERVSPDALEQLVAGEHEPAVVEQLPEQIELLRCELDLRLADLRLAPARVDDEVAVPEDRALPVDAVRRRAAHDRPHPRNELARIERLRHVVVGADLEADDLVHVLIARGEHEHRQITALADPLADLDAVDVGQHEVEDDERGLLGLDEAQRLVPARSRADGVARVLQIGGDEGRDRRLVLHDENRLRLRGHYPLDVIFSRSVGTAGSECQSLPLSE